MKGELLGHLYSLTLASSLGIVAVLACRPVIRRIFGASASYSLWLLIPLATLTVPLPHIRKPGSADVISSLIQATVPLTDALDRPAVLLKSAASSAPDWPLWTADSVWATGVTIFVLYFIGLQRAYLKSLGALSGRHGVWRAEHSTGCPALIGLLRPRVVLPADFRARYTRLERLLVFSHERTHLRRGDARWNALVALIRCIFWFNPLIHVASRCFRLDQELACDAAVTGDRPELRRCYATALLKAQLTDAALPLGCHWQSAQDLKERISMLRRRAPNRRRRLYGGALTTLLAAVVSFTAWAAQSNDGSAVTPSVGTAIQGKSAVMWIGGLMGWVSSPDPVAGQPVIIAVRNGRLGLSPGASPDITTAGRDTLLEGHLHLVFMGHQDGQAPPKTIVLQTNKAVVTQQADGSSVLQFDEGRLQLAAAPVAVTDLGTLQPYFPLAIPNSILLRFKDADVARVAAAVQMATGHTIVVDPRVHALLTMFSSTPVTPEVFYQAFLDVLHIGGFAVTALGPPGNVVRILPGSAPRR